MKRVICNSKYHDDWDDIGWNDKFSFDGKKIHIPERYLDTNHILGNPRYRNVFRKIEDTEGNVLLEPTYLHEDVDAELYRHFPSWGLKIVESIASIPNVWVVDYEEVKL